LLSVISTFVIQNPLPGSRANDAAPANWLKKDNLPKVHS